MASVHFVSTIKKPKILVVDPSTQEYGIKLLEQAGCEVTILEKLCEELMFKHIAGVDALLWAPPLKINKKVLDAAGSQMKTISTLSAGYDHIDINELKKRGIRLGNTARVNDTAVADLAVVLALGAARRIHEGRKIIESDQWKNRSYQWMLGQDIKNSTVGIIGLGGIGRALAKRLKGFEVKEILYSGHKERPEGKELNARFVSLDTLAMESDFVIACVPLNEETQHMCNAWFFSRMKSTAVFVNIGRGNVVDQPALIEALKNGTIFAAGLDVTTPEPLPPHHELLKLPNVVITPHIGSCTTNTRKEQSELAALNILKALAGEEMITPVI